MVKQSKTIVASHEGHEWNTIRRNIKIIYAWSDVALYGSKEWAINDEVERKSFETYKMCRWRSYEGEEKLLDEMCTFHTI